MYPVKDTSRALEATFEVGLAVYRFSSAEIKADLLLIGGDKVSFLVRRLSLPIALFFIGGRGRAVKKDVTCELVHLHLVGHKLQICETVVDVHSQERARKRLVVEERRMPVVVFVAAPRSSKRWVTRVSQRGTKLVWEFWYLERWLNLAARFTENRGVD